MDASLGRIDMALQLTTPAGELKDVTRPQLTKAVAAGTSRERIVSIDAFRGFTILAMIFVNRVADYDVADQFKHAYDYGLTFTDLVEPFFIFLVGVCIPLAFGRRTPAERRRKVVSRTLMLLILGIFYVSIGPHHEVNWYWGVLQSIALAYFLSALLMNFSASFRVGVVLLFLAIHSILTLKWHFYKAMMDFQGSGLSWRLEALTINSGIPGGLATSGTAIIGTIVGDLLRTKPSSRVLLRRLLWTGVLCCCSGAAVSLIKIGGVRQFSPNKNLATAGYVLMSTGISSFVLATFYVVVDVWKFRRWTWPLQVFSSNALLAYFLQPVVKLFLKGMGQGELWDTGYDPRSIIAAFNRWGMGKVVGGYVAGLTWVLLLWIVVYFLNRKNFFIRV